MIALTLTEIAEAVSGRLHLAGSSATAATVIDGATETDSREIAPGGIFVAKRGEHTDGHLFAPAALERGAALLIVERPLDLDVPQVLVDDSVEALGALATEVVRRVRAKGGLTVIGVTGSNGKTTTKNLLRTVLERVGETVAPRGSFNNEVGAPITMLQVSESTRFLVAEMGASAVGEIRRLVRMARPDVGVVLAVGLAHAGEFGGIERTLEAKTEMVADLTADDVAVLNADDGRVASMAGRTAARVLWFGRGESADVRAVDIDATADGTRFAIEVSAGEGREAARAELLLRVLGEHHVMNALAATAAALSVGVALPAIVEALATVTLAERGRMEVLGGEDVRVINDAYNASPDSTAAALRTLAQIAKPGGRTVAVLGEMSELGEWADEEHERVGLLAVRLNISQIVVVGRGARRIHVAAEREGSWSGESVFAETSDEAFDLLEDYLRPGDTVLVKSSNSAGLRFLADRLGERHR
ncbi:MULTISPECIES: UDP-N-acetylmuramoyl-tripeptide--D-alanyl-D-alanine ligase [unclassified Rathayibacter]|jgi:UDP-N-acetylmuramoyl-tripeptide--D-alanyl-D-alanine ligase|uniref:UDP-N-acetylmuramoyl-tripeptide--D-alanyl-D- alanine ligase n=3 Tax=Rathayibacter TaxID=33886 RepID=UPI000CE8A2C5|nr:MULTISPECIES: UDP-N-acetylmuramoyl-tripeptide--D-alanyl-D-alanine ligase [unclassified Rathayibacter]PPF11834.1 UDP-N-acetylmuramoylalanyl-D-glutamate--2,6-diaminopimelate ligase [Rathayibacter sp. AY1A5]PPF17449.1 UDP-N-acetylmuramoylalanyl-D-glutamate--2,6-diaminopimelate ligase [Rathayibacter sp. AY1A4]PPF19335.1 UDP-N-acetylmuramoylalanyl-D-glutamate--2,6-diaminopimelate ligase [Rathayibacter sp. AY1A7]PPF35846.1 UDP-N-acetylmuramoylalanyl-D-glutamate--2,6-diaminopimelate ligase [Rathayi